MPHLLLVDDENLLVHLFKRHLEMHGYRVSLAHDSLTALETVKHQAIDVVVTDMGMPGLDDEELLPQLRMCQPELPAIVVSGYTRNFTWDMDEQTKLFSKPVDLAQLLQALEEMLRYRSVLQRVA